MIAYPPKQQGKFMAYSHDELIKLIHQTKALHVWNHKTGPVFWYAANVPGPFYVNTEQLLGRTTADKMLADITAIIEKTKDATGRAVQVEKVVMDVYAKDDVFKKIIATMLVHAKEKFPSGSYDFISGGERRDWLFSVPFAKEIGIPHAYLFKNHDISCATPLKPQQKALHVCDLINNGASYFDSWLPALKKQQLECHATICVLSRNDLALKKLSDAGIEPLSLAAIDVPFFEQSAKSGLVDKDVVAEIETYFHSPQKWGEKYVMGNAAIFDAAHTDKKSFERLQFFFGKDPWNLRAGHEAFFAQMQKEIAARLEKAA